MARSLTHCKPTDLGAWWAAPIRSVMPGHLTGWLVNKATRNRYVFSVVNGHVSYMREPRRPSNIPHRIDDDLLKLQTELEAMPC